MKLCEITCTSESRGEKCLEASKEAMRKNQGSSSIEGIKLKDGNKSHYVAIISSFLWFMKSPEFCEGFNAS